MYAFSGLRWVGGAALRVGCFGQRRRCEWAGGSELVDDREELLESAVVSAEIEGFDLELVLAVVEVCVS